MASKRHPLRRNIRTRHPGHSDLKAKRFKAALEAQRTPAIDPDAAVLNPVDVDADESGEFGDEPTVSVVRHIHCAACGEVFAAADARPVCPGCGRTLILRGGL